MSTLHDRLRDLADEATEHPRPTDDPTDDLWDRGRRYGRRRRSATAALVTAVLLVAAAGAGSWWQVRPAGIDPAAEAASLRLPERLFTPSGWTPGTDETGPIGPLVAVVGAERHHWTGTGHGLAGVTSEGEYAFLDLPGWREDGGLEPTDLALSPDGRHLAYWYAGDGSSRGPDGRYAATGLAVHDTVTGETVRQEMDAPLGVMPQGLGWTGGTLWAPVWEYTERESTPDGGTSSSSFRHVLRWDLRSGDVAEDGPRALDDLTGATTWGDRLVVRRGRGVLRSVTADGVVSTVARLQGWTGGGTVVVSPDGTALAALGDTDPEGSASNLPEDVVVAPLPDRPGAVVDPEPVGSVPVTGVVGWRDDRHVVTLRHESGGAVYESLDVTTGERSRLVRLPTENVSPGTIVAADALRAPRVDVPPPPGRSDPRLVAAVGAGLALLVGLVGLRLWRRRVAP